MLDEHLWNPKEKSQVPPLRYAPVGMTILLKGKWLATFGVVERRRSKRIVIPTGAYPDFLPRCTGDDRVCAFP